MNNKNVKSSDYRRLADEIWQKAREEEAAGRTSLSDILKETSDRIHDIARKKYQEEEDLKKVN